MAFKFASKTIAEVPVTPRSSVALPFPWAEDCAKVQKDGKPQTFNVPLKEFWVEDRKLDAQGTLNQAKSKNDKATLATILGERIKSSFTAFRTSWEAEQKPKKFLGVGLVVIPAYDDKGEFTGHDVFLETQPDSVRKEGIARAAKAQKAKKAPAKKAA